MIFSGSITAPANTAVTAPVTQLLPIGKGIISRVMVRPRPGHAGLAHLLILAHEHPFAPSSPDMYLSGDAAPIDWDEFYEFYQPPYELKLLAWNEDDTYPHTFDVFVAVLPRRGILATAVADIMSGILGALSPRRIFTGGA